MPSGEKTQLISKHRRVLVMIKTHQLSFILHRFDNKN